MIFFLGYATRQVDHTSALPKPADPALWYYEPSDYDGDVLWSSGYLTLEAAQDAADLEPVDDPPEE